MAHAQPEVYPTWQLSISIRLLLLQLFLDKYRDVSFHLILCPIVVALDMGARLSSVLPKFTLPVTPLFLGAKLTQLLLLGIIESRNHFVLIKPHFIPCLGPNLLQGSASRYMGILTFPGKLVGY